MKKTRKAKHAWVWAVIEAPEGRHADLDDCFVTIVGTKRAADRYAAHIAETADAYADVRGPLEVLTYAEAKAAHDEFHVDELKSQLLDAADEMEAVAKSGEPWEAAQRAWWERLVAQARDDFKVRGLPRVPAADDEDTTAAQLLKIAKAVRKAAK